MSDEHIGGAGRPDSYFLAVSAEQGRRELIAGRLQALQEGERISTARIAELEECLEASEQRERKLREALRDLAHLAKGCPSETTIDKFMAALDEDGTNRIHDTSSCNAEEKQPTEEDVVGRMRRERKPWEDGAM